MQWIGKRLRQKNREKERVKIFVNAGMKSCLEISDALWRWEMSLVFDSRDYLATWSEIRQISDQFVITFQFHQQPK
jgi:hypothetical protein